jgi:hypothetical protein
MLGLQHVPAAGQDLDDLPLSLPGLTRQSRPALQFWITDQARINRFARHLRLPILSLAAFLPNGKK